MSTFKWGIFGTGAISAKFVAGLAQAADARPVMVASRTGAAARAFAEAFGIERPVEGYLDAARAGGVDAIYIATPPAQHHAHALACLEAGVPILVEKPFAADAAQARAVATAARSAGVFCMEGMWTRFIPAAQRLRTLVEGGTIGQVRQLTGSFGASNVVDPANGNFDVARGGGALAHLGVYPLSLAQWLFGAPTGMAAFANIGETGVDEDIALALAYPGGVLASFHASLRAKAANNFRVMGVAGSLSFRGPIFRPYGLERESTTPRRRETTALSLKARLRESAPAQRLAQMADRLGARGPRGIMQYYTGNGYHYEADEVRRCVIGNLTESPVMPLDDSVAVATTVDRVREVMVRTVAGNLAG